MTDKAKVIGTPPSIEWVDISRLTVDHSYQRLTEGGKSKRLIYAMSQIWNWALCQPLSVSRRPDGTLLVIDGQHRLCGAQARDDIAHLPCVISNYENAAQEAESFVALNTQRQRLTQFDIFVASLQAGDPDAKTIMLLLDKNNIGLARLSNTDRWKPRQIHSAPALQRMLKTHGAETIDTALHIFANGYPDRVCTSAATLLKALCFVVRDYPASIDIDNMVKALAATDPDLWHILSREQQDKNPAYSRTEAWVEALLTEQDGAKADAA